MKSETTPTRKEPTMQCPDCPHLFAGREDPRKQVRKVCCADEEARRAIEGSPRNMMVGQVDKPEVAPMSRADRRRAAKDGRRR